MYYVYVLRSVAVPDQRYIGRTNNLNKRLNEHNSGASVYTAKYGPWVVEVYVAFEVEKRAIEFEKYLKTDSGRAFACKRFFNFE